MEHLITSNGHELDISDKLVQELRDAGWVYECLDCSGDSEILAVYHPSIEAFVDDLADAALIEKALLAKIDVERL